MSRLLAHPGITALIGHSRSLGNYWWEFVLFLLIPLTTNILIPWAYFFLVWEVSLSFNGVSLTYTGDSWSSGEWWRRLLDSLFFGSPVSLVLLLALFWLPLRVLDRPFLRLVWEYILVFWVLETAFWVAPWLFEYNREVALWVKYLLQLSLLVWYASKAKQSSFRHALVVIGVSLVAASFHMPASLYSLLYSSAATVFEHFGIHYWPYSYEWSEWWAWIWRAWHLILGILLAWILGRTHMDGSPPAKGLMAVFAIQAVAFIAGWATPWISSVNLVLWALQYGLILYLVHRSELVAEILARVGERVHRYWEGDFG